MFFSLGLILSFFNDNNIQFIASIDKNCSFMLIK
jgi:hypothetical protein